MGHLLPESRRSRMCFNVARNSRMVILYSTKIFQSMPVIFQFFMLNESSTRFIFTRNPLGTLWLWHISSGGTITTWAGISHNPVMVSIHFPARFSEAIFHYRLQYIPLDQILPRQQIPFYGSGSCRRNRMTILQ